MEYWLTFWNRCLLGRFGNNPNPHFAISHMTSPIACPVSARNVCILAEIGCCRYSKWLEIKFSLILSLAVKTLVYHSFDSSRVKHTRSRDKPWPHSICLIRLEIGSESHVIQHIAIEDVGGTIKVRFVCGKCPKKPSNGPHIVLYASSDRYFYYFGSHKTIAVLVLITSPWLVVHQQQAGWLTLTPFWATKFKRSMIVTVRELATGQCLAINGGDDDQLGIVDHLFILSLIATKEL